LTCCACVLCTIHTHNRWNYAAITMTTSIPTRTLVPDM